MISYEKPESSIKYIEFVNIQSFSETIEHAKSCIKVEVIENYKKDYFGFCPDYPDDVISI